MITECLRTLHIRTSSEKLITRWIHDVNAACIWLTECGPEVLAYLKSTETDLPSSSHSFNIDPRKDSTCCLTCNWMPCAECRESLAASMASWDAWKQRLQQILSYEADENQWDGKGILRRGAFLTVKAPVLEALRVMDIAEKLMPLE